MEFNVVCGKEDCIHNGNGWCSYHDRDGQLISTLELDENGTCIHANSDDEEM